ncbi:MAG: Asp-tRNA(Asn)/Glu-tRNA(Gln) amidotransferase subunit GatB [Bdellovibrionales bacterium]|nr:Asp-tRNA(Asn)/Glu-tRNA(Gln) amidotransferase subunit GatB [Bdellovibrionales bacterium]
MNYETVIGLEVHAQLKTKTKLFCRCENIYGQSPNTLTCPVCLAMPGALPVTNIQAIEFAIKAGFALGCEIQNHSVFSRKNYFYPDLPKGYQISQFDLPLCLNGQLEVTIADQTLNVRIQRIHVEEDAGKLLHGDNLQNKEGSLVDLNRAGVPLIEIVSHPDMRSAEQAAEYLRQLRSILRYIGVCDGNMEEGSLRCDANISIRKPGEQTLGTKVEVKNMNSFKNVQKAIEYEVERQVQFLESGKTIIQETRLWNPDRNITTSMRSKEEAHDYRYFPDPDLLPLELDTQWIETIKSSLDELPHARLQRFQKDLKLPPYDASILTSEKEIADYFEHTLSLYDESKTPAKAKALSNLIMGDVLRLSNELSTPLHQMKITPVHLCKLMNLIDEGQISGKIAKDILDDMAKTGQNPEEIVKEKGLTQISDQGTLHRCIQEVIENNPKQVSDFRAGKEKILGYLVGQVMKATQGKANPAMVNTMLIEELKK